MSVTEVSLLREFVPLFFWSDEFCSWLGCFCFCYLFVFCLFCVCLVIWPITLVAYVLGSSSVTFYFQLNLFFQMTLLYSSLFTYLAYIIFIKVTRHHYTLVMRPVSNVRCTCYLSTSYIFTFFSIESSEEM